MKRRCLALSLATLVGCTASYDRTDIDQVSTDELSSGVSSAKIYVTEGSLVSAHIAPFNSDGHPMVGSVVSDDPAIIEVRVTPKDKVYAFLGVRVGKTRVRFEADGITVQTVEAEVLPQP